MYKSSHRTLLLTPGLGLGLLLACLAAGRLAALRPVPADPADSRFNQLISVVERGMDTMRERMTPEPPLAGLKERFAPPPRPEPGTATALVPDVPTAAPSGDTPAPPPVPLELTGILSKNNTSYAIINRQVLKAGDEIAGYKLVALARKTVTLRNAAGHERILTLIPKEQP